MPLSLKHERFAQLYVLLGSAAGAYRQLGGRAASSRNADVNSAQMMARPGVRERVAELRKEQAQKRQVIRDRVEELAEEKIYELQFTRDQGIAWLTKIIMMPVKDPVSVPEQLQAFQLLVKMNGWNAAERLELGVGNSLTAYLADLRAERDPQEAQAIEIKAEAKGLESGGDGAP